MIRTCKLATARSNPSLRTPRARTQWADRRKAATTCSLRAREIGRDPTNFGFLQPGFLLFVLDPKRA